MNWAALGALLYTAGAIFELAQWPVIVPGLIQAHEVLHFRDTAASVAFFVFVVREVIPYQPTATAATESMKFPAMPSIHSPLTKR